MKHLFCDCKTDKEKANFFLSGRAVETGIVASAISNDVAMAYHRCAEFQKEIDALRAKIERMEKRLRLILEEPENTMSNSKALREMVRQARLALEETK